MVARGLLLGGLQAVAAALRPFGQSMRSPRQGHMRMSADSLGRPDVCIVGGGFGGLYTALKLSGLGWGDGPAPRVTLIDRSERFVFLPMLYEVTTGSASCWEVAPRFEELLAGSGALSAERRSPWAFRACAPYLARRKLRAAPHACRPCPPDPRCPRHVHAQASSLCTERRRPSTRRPGSSRSVR
jgi:hypothetical protein